MTCITHYKYKKHDRDIVVYRALFVNGKSYIGITSTSLERRKYDHLNKAKKNKGHRFHKAIAKHGDPEWSILQTVKTVEEACSLEKHYIALYDTFGRNGYNSTMGGDMKVVSLPISEETRRKLSESHKGKKWSEEHKKAFSKSMRGSRMPCGRVVERVCSIIDESVVYERALDAEKDGFKYRCVIDACNRRRLTYKKYVWNWVETIEEGNN